MHVRTTHVPAFVLDNLDTLNFTTKLLDVKAISKHSGLSCNSISALARGWAKPSVAPYNAIAEFMHWQKWDVSNGGEN